MKDSVIRPKLNGKEVNAIIFDMDGTLSDSIDTYLYIVSKAATSVGLKFSREEVLASLANQTYIWSGLLSDDPSRHEGITKKMATVMMEIYTDVIQRVKVFPNLGQALKRLKDYNIKMGVVTGSPRLSLTPLYNSKLEHYFQTMISRDDGYPGKPAPDSMIACLKQMDTESGRAIVVGDTPVDIIAGKKCVALTIGVLTGVATREMLEKETPTAIVNWVGDIPALLGI